ncbi:MAG: hypothetical protein KBT34_04860 [Prevotella sp.]|nr:hypothetical protein [Candidatus Prevotella equi]
MTKTLHLMLSLLLALTSTCVMAQKITATWAMNSLSYNGECALTGEAAYTQHVTNTNYVVGNKLTAPKMLTASGAETGFTAVTYPNPMIAFQPAAKVSSVTTGHSVTFSITIAAGHTFKPTAFKYNAAKVGTDAGGMVIKQKIGSGAETTLAEVSPRRNKITASEKIGYTDGTQLINEVLFEGGQTYSIIVYITGNLATDKQLAIGNVSIEGEIDEGVKNLSDYITAFSCKADGKDINLYDRVKTLNNGDKVLFNQKFLNEPSDFTATAKSGFTTALSYKDKEVTLEVKKGSEVVYTVGVGFMTTKYTKHTGAKQLNRGLLAVQTGILGGVLVSWRARAKDTYGETQYKLYKNDEFVTTLTTKTNYFDQTGNTSAKYKIEVCDKDGNVLETQETSKVWNRQYLSIPLAKAPEDTNGTGATYTPNDATVYDMDGDGEQEIVFRWEPSNVRDGANTGTTGAVYLECIKLDGTQLWRINLGQNIWASQHTVTFLCYDFDGDGFGEMICRTAPGTKDGEGNFVVMGNDNPYANYVSARGRVEDGPEYLTVFDGMTGAAISSMHYWPSHADFGTPAQNESKYGSQARIERYNATMARLDVNGKATPCAVMNHGYYSAAYYLAACYDGNEIKEVWRSSFEKSTEGMYGQGYHTLQSADVDDDGFDEIIVGSGVMDHNGKSLWRSGEGHGDALHVGDFDWDNPGLEVFSVMEDYDKASVTYCMDMRDAKTGKLLWGWPKGTSDCGRGICADFVPEYDGAEASSSRSSSLHTSKGEVINNTNVVNDGKNFRIYWTGDLYDENLDGTWISKWNSSAKRFDNITKLETVISGTSSINGTKNVPCVQADFLGDYREELIYYYTVNSANSMYGLRIFTTNYESSNMLPYLRDDAMYDNAIVWQNTTYNQPPHLSYSPVLYMKEVITAANAVKATEAEAEGDAYNVIGQKVSPDAKGLVIKNGKPVLQK